MAANKDKQEADTVASRKRVKIYSRRVDQRMDEVNVDHQTLMGKYDFLLHANDYFAKLAEQIITIIELNSSLLRQDEQDKQSISLLG